MQVSGSSQDAKSAFSALSFFKSAGPHGTASQLASHISTYNASTKELNITGVHSYLSHSVQVTSLLQLHIRQAF